MRAIFLNNLYHNSSCIYQNTSIFGGLSALVVDSKLILIVFLRQPGPS